MSFLTRRGEGPSFRYAGQLQVTGDQTLEVGAALSPDTPPDPDQMRELYLRHASRLLP